MEEMIEDTLGGTTGVEDTTTGTVLLVVQGVLDEAGGAVLLETVGLAGVKEDVE
jgi:hypothetical protein